MSKHFFLCRWKGAVLESAAQWGTFLRVGVQHAQVRSGTLALLSFPSKQRARKRRERREKQAAAAAGGLAS